MAKEGTSGIDLLYPFYLDIDMTLAYAAALAGGVALEMENVDAANTEGTKTRELRAGIRLFDMFDVGGKGKTSTKEGTKSQSRIIRHHTEASIFITLYNELTRLGAIAQPDIETFRVGQLTSLEVGPANAPLLRVVDQILRLLDLFSPEGQAAPLIPGSGDSVEAMRTLFRSLKGDLQVSGMTDIVIRQEEKFGVVLTLDNRFVSPQALELLHTSSFRVVGKVTQVWREKTDVINLYRRSVLSLVPSLPGAIGFLVLGLLGALAKNLDVAEIQRAANEAIGNEDYEPIVNEVRISDEFQSVLPILNGPAIQILPLAICA